MRIALLPVPLVLLSCTPAPAVAPSDAQRPPAGAAASATPGPRGVSTPVAGAPVAVPAELVANRFFVIGTLQDGRTLRFYSDSGGGSQFLYEDTVARMGLAVSSLSFAGENKKITAIPAWHADGAIPPPLAIHQPPALQSHYLVLPRRPEAEGDGFLGQGWFGGRVWTFDYPGKRLLWRADGDIPPHAKTDEIPLHFPLAKDGLPAMHFGRMTVSIDGEAIDLLFDTGAMLSLSPEGLSALKDGGPEVRGTSFIAKNVFDRWRAKHPDWKVIEKAERGTGAPIIEVPRITVAGHEVGPVWFTFRPDSNFHEFMSSMMDARVEGALGGSALGYFVVTVDYAKRLAVFQLPQLSR